MSIDDEQYKSLTKAYDDDSNYPLKVYQKHNESNTLQWRSNLIRASQSSDKIIVGIIEYKYQIDITRTEEELNNNEHSDYIYIKPNYSIRISGQYSGGINKTP